MSINSALLAGVSGLTANSAALAAISQNIANVNTVGYKRTAGEFQTVINSQSQGAGYSAGGVLATARHFTSQAGQLQRTTSNTDLGIAGQGFFVVTEKSCPVANGGSMYTRSIEAPKSSSNAGRTYLLSPQMSRFRQSLVSGSAKKSDRCRS